MATFRPQYSFTSGQVDPNLYQRGDLETYYKSLQRADNCLIKVTGGLKRRYGTRFIDYTPIDTTEDTLVAGSFTIPNLASGAAADLVDNDRATTVVTSTATGTDFVIFSYDLGTSETLQYVTIEDVLLVGGTIQSANQLRLQVSTDAVSWETIYAGSDTGSTTQYYATTTKGDWSFRVGSDTRYFRMVSLYTFDATVSISGVRSYTAGSSTDNFRIIDFTSRQTDNVDETRIAVFGANFAEIYDGSTGDRINSIFHGKTALIMEKCDYEVDLDGRLLFSNTNIKPFEIVPTYSEDDAPASYLTQDLDLQNIPSYEFKTTDESDVAWGTLTPTETSGYTQLSASSGTPFLNAKIGWKVDLEPIGKVRITKVVSDTVVKGFVEQKIQDTSAVAAGEWTIEKGWEDMISDAKGWPISLCFFNSRLYFGGSKSFPNMLMASTIEDNFDFDLADQSDSDGFWKSLGSKRSSNIYMLQARKTLEIYCDGGIYVLSATAAITPTTVKVNKVTSSGIKRYTNAESINDGGSVYINNNENAIYWMVYSDERLNYHSKTISAFASSLVSCPSSNSFFNTQVWQGDSNFRNNFMVFINEDYEITFVSLLLEEKVNAFSTSILKERDASGDLQSAKVRYICPSKNNFFMIAEFSERGTKEILLMDNDYYLDGSETKVVSSDTISGLTRFEGMYIDVVTVTEGKYLGKFAVSGGNASLGETTYDGAAVECGSAFFADVETMPIEDIQNIGSSIGKDKNISEVYINPVSIANLYLNDRFVLDKDNDNSTTDPFVNRTLNGWSRSRSIKLSQEKPLDFEIKNILIKAEVNS